MKRVIFQNVMFYEQLHEVWRYAHDAVSVSESRLRTVCIKCVKQEVILWKFEGKWPFVVGCS